MNTLQRGFQRGRVSTGDHNHFDPELFQRRARRSRKDDQLMLLHGEDTVDEESTKVTRASGNCDLDHVVMAETCVERERKR